MKTASVELGDHIAQQIEKLSDPNYSSRIRAQEELERIGVLALDQLHIASFHPDPQIASTARYIVQSNQFSWSWETDPVSVRQILTNYSAVEHDKSIYIDQLNRLEHDEGFGALCRLARYETRSGLAKRAALLLMRSKPTVGQTLESRKESMRYYVNGGQSTASRWVARYAEKNANFDLAWWEHALSDELNALKTSSNETNLETVTDLHRWVVEQIFDQPNLRDNALSLGRSILSLSKTVPTLESMIGNRSTRANEFAQWALKYKLTELVQEQHAKLPFSIVSNEMMFGYLLAESFLMQEKSDLAIKVAELSLNQQPCTELGEIKKPVPDEVRPGKQALDFSNRRNGSDQERRSSLGQKLQERGQFEWAEAEFRLGINDDLTDRITQFTMIQLSEMLQSQSKHREAANVLQPFVDRFTKEDMFRRQVKESFINGAQVMSFYYLYIADDARDAGDFGKAAKNYWQSIELVQDDIASINVDAIIGLYKTPLSVREAERRSLRQSRIVAEFRKRIREYEDSFKRSKPSDLATLASLLSNDYNTLAWVIVNTEGSKEEAIYLSRKACSLAPEHAEYLDTLAYCYAAIDQYQDAVQQQRRAVELKPHHPDLVKALKRFEAKLQSSTPTSSK